MSSDSLKKRESPSNYLIYMFHHQRFPWINHRTFNFSSARTMHQQDAFQHQTLKCTSLVTATEIISSNFFHLAVRSLILKVPQVKEHPHRRSLTRYIRVVFKNTTSAEWHVVIRSLIRTFMLYYIKFVLKRLLTSYNLALNAFLKKL